MDKKELEKLALTLYNFQDRMQDEDELSDKEIKIINFSGEIINYLILEKNITI